MKIGVIGTGISGLVCAYHLSKKYEVSVFEANSSIGGHTATVDVQTPRSGHVAIDTGFIVFNDWTYPNFIHLIDELRVPWKPSTMSFSVQAENDGIEYNGTDLNGLFAQRRNLLSPSFHRMIRDILRFNREAVQMIAGDASSNMPLEQYLVANGYRREFIENYIIPMGAAIWSASRTQMRTFPLRFFVQFFKNHGMLSVDDRPVWRVILNGSRSYLEPLTRSFASRIHVNSPVLGVKRSADGVLLRVGGPRGQTEFQADEVIFASHSDQTLRMLEDADDQEREILGKFAYQPNAVTLHTDQRVLPKRRRAWAAWNYLVPAQERGSVALSYNMNLLQGLSVPETFCVSLNMDDRIREEKILRRFTYDHPVFTRDAVSAQARWSDISGKRHTHFCGAYWRNGFHEDGVVSALKVCKALEAPVEIVSHERKVGV
jgi:predicted NAD/FAD-binding protein